MNCDLKIVDKRFFDPVPRTYHIREVTETLESLFLPGAFSRWSEVAEIMSTFDQ